MSLSIYWFRCDLRLTDNSALKAACAASDELMMVYVQSPDETQATRWGFPRWGEHRRGFRDQALQGVRDEIAQLGNQLLVLQGLPSMVIADLARQTGAGHVFCERIAAPEEMAEVAALRAEGLVVHEHWQSSLLEPADLPFDIAHLPEVYTGFRLAIERAGVKPPPSCSAPRTLPPLPKTAIARVAQSMPLMLTDAPDPALHGSERSGLAHMARYFASTAPQSYKKTRNQLSGADYSTQFSPWLAVGALSARSVFQALQAHEAEFGANDSTYWIWFELLWRDYFRFWGIKHGKQLFHARGLGPRPPSGHDPIAFQLWCDRNTDHAFINAGMRELAATGRLSNRMRQIVASYLVHDLACDWRAGAAWFEARLIDYDVYSNQGNWLSIAGLGANRRGGRWFNADKQASDHDADGSYRAKWSNERGITAP